MKNFRANLCIVFALAGCMPATVYVRMTDPVCLAAPKGFVLKDDYNIDSGKFAGTVDRCPTILVPATVQRDGEGVAASAGGAESSSIVVTPPGTPGSGDAGSSAPTVTVESSVTGGGSASAQQTTVTGSATGTAPERTVSVIAGGVTIYSDGSVETPNLGVVK